MKGRCRSTLGSHPGRHRRPEIELSGHRAHRSFYAAGAGRHRWHIQLPGPTTSASIRGRRSWSSSSIRQGGSRSRKRSAATPPSGARPWRSSAATAIRTEASTTTRTAWTRVGSSRRTSRSSRRLDVSIHDSPTGLVTEIHDLTMGESGSMTASVDNRFAQVNFEPNATTCTQTPYAFHPMYATSSEHTRVPWAAHSYNAAFSDEIGRFEFCDRANPLGKCVNPGLNDKKDGDDVTCFNADESPLVEIGGCIATDNDFDGVSYQSNWPGTAETPALDAALNPSSILFTSPTFGGGQNFDRVEADLPRIEAADFGGICDRSTGGELCQPAARFQRLSLLQHQGGSWRRLPLAARWRRHPRYDEHVRRELGARVRTAAVPGRSGTDLHADPSDERLSSGACEQPLSADVGDVRRGWQQPQRDARRTPATGRGPSISAAGDNGGAGKPRRRSLVPRRSSWRGTAANACWPIGALTRRRAAP
jgi:hypothetical protein